MTCELLKLNRRPAIHILFIMLPERLLLLVSDLLVLKCPKKEARNDVKMT